MIAGEVTRRRRRLSLTFRAVRHGCAPCRCPFSLYCDSQQAAILADHGFKLKTEDDGSQSYRFRIKVQGTKKDGSKFDKPKPKVVDASKQPFTQLIGNGSLVNIQYKVDTGMFAGTPYCKGELQAVQVLELVSFGEPAGDEFEDEGNTQTILGEGSEEASR